MDITASGIGLAFSSGINAYMPLLSYAIAARFFHLYKVNPDFAYITSDWFMIALAILALADLFADKIPGVDHVWDIIHTVVRPIAGALVAAAASGHTSGAALAIPLIVGGSIAGVTHATKATTRAASTVGTAGFLNIGISILEDIGMIISVILSLLAPTVMVVIVVLCLALFIFVGTKIAKRLRARRQRRQQAKTMSSV
ncbi:DUF4126 domain-containing protein [Ktedonobacter racemifer]|uniref:Conserved hypothetical membrane spanning protein n=1 Tax=Ktedonobacter racemifer DSM 44963 TaxID=485913 RepID=D6TKG1_KTERA|nr:DUF4126 domain-containing protein [Ktedonobacter racemifer]EFH86261.1 conserved hypothetical membrane spanning protein [Ktedonobacter racemifer DSM 44963]